MPQTKREWTPEQLTAIETRGRTLIVSAAAGSGKTATLTERIIRLVTDPKDPMDLSRMLIVTFTNAAAEEVRTRVADALRAEAKEHPGDSRLERQLLTVRSAHIQTIDAFCNSLLRSSPDAVGLSPDFRIADTAEASLLSSSVMENLISEIYDGNLPNVASPEDFEELTDCLTSAKSSGDLAFTFDKLYRKCSGLIDGVRALRPLIALYDPAAFTSASDTPFGQYACRQTVSFAEHAVTLYERAIRELSYGSEEEEKIAVFLDAEKDRLARFASADTFSKQRAIPPDTFGKMPPVKKDRVTETITRVKSMRDGVKKSLGKILSSFYLWTDEEWREHFATVFRTGTVLCNFMEAFDAAFTAEKRRLNLLDFSDLEHLAYDCLYDKDRNVTPLALSLRSSFDTVCIDEYQDVNELQDALFAAVSRPGNRFMVGDIKQCIYCFRGAEPRIFAGMKKRFPPIEQAIAEDSPSASLFMSKNFRCDATVLDFVNGVFDTLFPLVSPALGHDVNLDTLRVGKFPEAQSNFVPEIHLVPKAEKSGTDEESDPDLPEADGGADPSEAEEATNRERQATAVANLVADLLRNGTKSKGEPILPSDVAILLRNTTGVADAYRNALEKAGVPTEISGSENFFLNAEVLLALSLLTSIDNPHRDVYLSGLLCSPLFAFSGDEILRLRRAGGDTLYDALRIAVSEEGGAHPGEISDALREKTAGFLSALAHYRAISGGMRTDMLLSRLYRETGLLPLASNAGGAENLLVLQNFAKTYEKNGFRGLSGFLAYVRELIDTGAGFESPAGGKKADAVRILTDHKSKGLEYPVCILAECQSRISNKDKKERIAFDPAFGLSMRDRAPGGLALVENAVQAIVNEHIFDNIYEEELRVLYVAMTRAKERLYLFGVPSKDPELFVEEMRDKKETLTEYSAKHLTSFLEMAMMSSGAFRVVIEDDPMKDRVGGAVLSPFPKVCGQEPTGDVDLSDREELKSLLLERFTFSYPSPAETTLPRKLSVGALSPAVLDINEKEEIALTIEDYLGENSSENAVSDNNCLQKEKFPVFYTGRRDDISAKKGIATHTFLQFCDFEALCRLGTDAELARMRSAKFLSAEDGELVRLDEIRKFERSALLEEICRAKKIFRELRFHVRLPAELFAEDPARRDALRGKQLLVQGVIDCIYEDGAGDLHLIDYKTDRLPKEALNDKALAQKILADKHRRQLSYYAEAIREMFGKPPVTAEVYSLPLGDTVRVKLPLL